ncbi:cyclin-J-like protein [Malaya genurostris]|uniref:cyclin-J-like protein n=1 Tax=Malaya genurostris TaxID=325434 RepID=UPI0026F3A06E|nr:cyclin-J-like protein [Malaya genurostris]
MEQSYRVYPTLPGFAEHCTEYSDEIVWILQESELNRLTIRYTSPQLRYRDALVNFVRLVGECKTCTLRRSTVHLAIYMLDTFMDNHNITDNRLNLVALSCVILAAKIEENEPNVPKMKIMNKLIRNQYASNDYIVLEVLLLKFFNWNLIIPTTATFVEYWLLNVVGKHDFPPSTPEKVFHEHREDAINLVLDFLDITLVDIKMNNIRPSLLASACLAAARFSIHVSNVWSESMEELTGYSLQEIDTLWRELSDSRAYLNERKTACRKRSAFDSGYITDSYSIDDVDGEEWDEYDTEDTDDENVLAFQSKRAR